MEELRRGSRQRQRASTDMNAASSRSHSIFTLSIAAARPRNGNIIRIMLRCVTLYSRSHSIFTVSNATAWPRNDYFPSKSGV